MKKSPLLVIFLTVFLDLVGFGIIVPLMPFYATHFGASASFIGFFSASFSAMQVIFAPLWGRLSDKIGRRPIILFGVAGTIGSMLLLAFAGNKWMLLASRAFAGIASANIGAAQAYISDVTTPENRAKGMGLVGAAFGLGFIFGPAIGGGLSQFGERMPAFFAAGLAALNFALALFLLPESLSPELRAEAANNPRPRQSQFQRVWHMGVRHPQVGSLMLLFFIVTLAFANLEATFALFTERRLGFSPAQVGYVFAYIGIIAIIVQGGLIGRLTRWAGEPRLLICGVGALAFGLLGMTLVHGVATLLAVITLISIGNGLYGPSSSALISKLAPPAERGSLLGVQQSLGALGRMFGPPLGGFVFDRFNEGMPYFVGSSLLFLGAVFAALFVLPRTTLRERDIA